MTISGTALTASSNLIDDYLMIETPPVTKTPAGKFVAVTSSIDGKHISELLTVGPDDTSVLHFVRDKDSHSGWNPNLVPLPVMPAQPIARLHAFYEAGVLNVLTFWPKTAGGSVNAMVWLQRSAQGYWNSLSMDEAMAAVLGATTEMDAYRNADGNHILYGISEGGSKSSFFMISRNATSNTFGVNFQMDAAETTPSYLILSGLGGAELTVLQIQGSTVNFRGGSISDGTFAWDMGSEWKKFGLHAGDLTINQLYALPTAAGRSAFLVRADNAVLYYVSDFGTAAPNTLDLTAAGMAPSAVTAVALGLDSQNLCMVFALDADNVLWLLRQTGIDSSGNATFAENWVQLGDTMRAIACPPMTADGPQVFAVNQGYEVLHLDQKLVQAAGEAAGVLTYGNWFTHIMDGPTPATSTPKHVTTYTTEIAAVNENGTAVPGTKMYVKADRPTVVIANDVSYHIGPNAPAELFTNRLGKATVAINATAVTAPLLSVNVPDYMKPDQWQEHAADKGVYNRVADPTFTTAKNLENKKTGILQANYPSADTVAAAIQSTGQLLVQRRNSSTAPFDPSKVNMPHWQADFTTSRGPTFERLTAAEAQELIREAVAAGNTASALSWSSFWGDIAHFFKHIFREITKFVHTVEEDVIKVAIHIGKGIKKFVLHLVLKTVDDLGDLLELIGRWVNKAVHTIEEAVDKVIDWIRELFDWDDILNTHTVIKHYVNSILTNLRNSDKDAINLVKDGFDEIKGKVKTAFNHIEGIFENGGSGLSFNQFAAKQSGGSANSLHGKTYHDTYNSNAARCNYVHAKAQHHFANSTSLSSILSAPADTGTFENLVTLIKAQEKGLLDSTKKLQDALSVKTSDPKQFFDKVILEFLAAAEVVVLFVLDVVEDILIALLDLIGTAISTLQTALIKPIEIPIITWLWKHIITDGEPFSFIDLLCLIMAVPGTILYKLLFAASDPKNKPFTASQVASIKGKDIPWPSFGTATAEASSAPPAEIETEEQQSIYVILFALGGISYFVYTIVDVSIDALASDVFGSSPADEENSLETYLSWAGIAISCAMQGLMAPYQIFGKDDWSEADKATVALWGVSFAPILLNTVFTAFMPDEAESRFSKTLGQAALSIFGAGVLGTGIWATVEQHAAGGNGWTEAANIISPIPTACAWLLMAPVQAASEDLSVAFLLALAVICDFGAMVTTIASDA